ncbi:VapD family protein [Thomasclavelia spiroformis]|uniref:VapD family protein n=1 Tax=Thomasclavelia spiroformis TaxID=29348 RepID=UPI0039A1DBDC
MLIIHSRKAINFDLNNNLLKQYYPSKNYKKAWKDINKYLENNDFIHRQYSGYVSKIGVSMAEVGNIIGKMSRKWTWLNKCVMEFDVTKVGDEYSFISRIKQESKVTSKDELV